MIKYLFCLIFFCSVTVDGAENYYPKGSVSDSEQEWYAKHLSAMREPILNAKDLAAGDFVFRVLYLPTWGRPAAFRVEKKGRHIIRRSVMLSGKGGYAPGRIKKQKQVKLSEEEFAAFRQDLGKSRLLDLPLKDGVMGLDGSQLIAEVLQNGKHLVFVRWTPESDTAERNLDGVVSFYTRIFEEVGFWKKSND